MGQEYSQPQPGVKLQVIGAGLPRTGTASFSRALEILYEKPIYHGGTQVTLGPEKSIKNWLKILSQRQPPDASARAARLKMIEEEMDGFAATTDYPACGVLSELMELFPEAKVVCTVRDVEGWEKSMGTVASAATKWFLRFVLFPLPALRYFPDYIDVLRDSWFNSFGETEPPTQMSYKKHMAWLKENVPADRLVFFDVKDGWEPLCKGLGLPVPKDVPFPRINDTNAMDAFAERQVQRGLKRWAVILGTTGVAVAGVMRLWA